MKTPADFYKPLAIGAPLPMRERPVRPERMIHFFPPHIEKVRSKVPSIAGTVDVLLGNLEDALPADARLLRAADLEVSEAALTGESMPVAKATLEALPAGLRFVALLITTMSLLWGVITFWVYGWANPVGYVLAGFLVPVGVLISGLKVEPPEEGEDDWFWDPANLASSHIQGTPAWHAYGRAMDDD